jgi:Domain of unknown function (DUF1707)
MSDLRASDADREATVSRLQEAGGEGRITFEEVAERVELADAARTRADLERLTEDLPAAAASAAPAPARKPRGWVVAVMGGAERKGRWRPAETTHVVSVMAGAVVDLREAEIGPEVHIRAWSLMGGIEVVVPEGVQVELAGFALMGGNAGPRVAEIPPGAPVVRVQAYSLMGGVGVSRKPPRDPR